MSFEIESKYALADVDGFLADAATLELTWSEPTTQVDRYLRHPCRDFAKTGEAFRLRLSGGEVLATYKGPRQSHAVKTRRELELPLSDDPSRLEAYAALFGFLGFEPVAEVRKTRRKATFRAGGAELEICLDRVDELGDFVEIEAIADDDHVAAAQTLVHELAERFDLGQPEPRSYLRMLLEKRDGT